MTESQGGVATRPYKCLRIHVIGDNADQCKDRLDTLNAMIREGRTEDAPEWAEVTWNHGGGGGP